MKIEVNYNAAKKACLILAVISIAASLAVDPYAGQNHLNPTNTWAEWIACMVMTIIFSVLTIYCGIMDDQHSSKN